MYGLTQNRISPSSKRVLREGSWVSQGPSIFLSELLSIAPDFYTKKFLMDPRGHQGLVRTSTEKWTEETGWNRKAFLPLRMSVCIGLVWFGFSWNSFQLLLTDSEIPWLIPTQTAGTGAPWSSQIHHQPNTRNGGPRWLYLPEPGILPPKRGERMMGSHMVSDTFHTCADLSLKHTLSWVTFT